MHVTIGDERRILTRSNGQLQMIRPCSEFNKRALDYSVGTFWNSIPNDVLDSGSVKV